MAESVASRRAARLDRRQLRLEPLGLDVEIVFRLQDLPGCSVGETPDEARAGIRRAIEFHLEGMRVRDADQDGALPLRARPLFRRPALSWLPGQTPAQADK